jgi:ubiquinone/menaquinone biosynthesis C-methylase UbiE
MFDGLGGRVMAKVMRFGNVDMEHQAIDELAPSPTDRVLEIGFGPGEGIRILADVISSGRVAGADPSAVMVETARRRNRRAIASGRVELALAPADKLPWPDSAFDGCICVNTIQLWDPFDQSVAELARVLRPGGQFVALTHDWAINKLAPVDEWLATAQEAFSRHGFAEWRTWTGRARSGGTVGIAAAVPS